MILLERFCPQHFCVTPEGCLCFRGVLLFLEGCADSMTQVEDEPRIFCVECMCGKVIQSRMLRSSWTDKSEEELKHRVHQHMHTLAGSGHVALTWNEVVDMPVVSYNLGWEDSVEVLSNNKLIVPKCTLLEKRLPTDVAASSSDETDVAASTSKRSRKQEVAASASTSFVELNTDEKLIRVMTVLERIEGKLDHALLLQ